MPLSSFLSRLIWLSLLPMILAAGWLGYQRVEQERHELEAHSRHLAGQFAEVADRFLQTRLAALQVLAGSPLLDDPPRLEVFHRRALEFQKNFAGHLILADADLQMLLNTRTPYGVPLPRLPQPPENVVAPAVLASGAPRVSDIVQGPVAGTQLIALVVPVERAGRPRQLLLATFELAQIQTLMEGVWLPEGRMLRLLDGAGQVIAARGAPVSGNAGEFARRFTVETGLARWVAELGIPTTAYQAPLFAAAYESLFFVLLALLIGSLGGRWASRRFARMLGFLADDSPLPNEACSIKEVGAVRHLLESRRRQLQESESRYRSLFENSHSTMLVIDPADGRIVDANRAAEIFYGWSRAVLVSMSIRQINILPQDEVARQMEAARITQRNIFHFRHRRADGSIRDVEVHSGPVRMDERILLYSIIYDETERLAAERDLGNAVATAQHLRDALDQVQAYVYIKDRESCYVYANRRTLSLFGCSALELLGKPDASFFPPNTASRLREIDRRVLAGESTAEEIEVCAPDGSKRVYWEVKSPIYLDDTHKAVWGISGISTDITALKALEASLAFQNRRSQFLLELPVLADQLDEADFMQRGLEMAEILTNSQISFIHFVNPDEDTIELVTWSRRTLDSYCQAAFDRHYPVSQAGIWAEALRQKQPVVFNDYASAPDKHGLPEGHAALARLISLPVIEAGKVVMLAGVGNKPQVYTEADTETLQLFANDIWRLVQRSRSREKIESFSRMIEHSTNEIFSFDSETLKFVEVNRGACANLGYTIEELRNMTPLDIKPQMDADTFAALLAPLRSGAKKVIEFTTQHQRKDGSTYDVEIRLELTQDAHPLFVAVVHDITERLRLEQTVRQLAQAVEQSPESIAIADLEANLDYVNAAFVRNTGYSRAEALGQNPRILQSGKTPPATYAAMWNALVQGRPWQGELINRRKDGSEYIEWARISPIRQPDGRITHYLAIKEDITARREAEAQQKEANRQIEAMQGQLLQSEKMASIGQLAAGVAHELNNPIGFVNSNLGTLDNYLHDLFAILNAYAEAEAATGPQCPQLERVHTMKYDLDYDFLCNDIYQLMAESKDGLARVAKIVRDLKDFSRAGDSVMQWADLHQGLDSTLNIVWNELKYKCTVTKRYGDLPQVWCEPSQLNQVFMNLLVNAGHAIADKGEITITTGRVDEEVFVAIADTGRGIAPENLTRIFDPFFTTKPVGKGTGLGLSLAYGIVQKHHGRIEVQSELGRGTTFTVWLPIGSAGSATAPTDGH